MLSLQDVKDAQARIAPYVVRTPLPVSYTHLDVYKRQGQQLQPLYF